MPRRELHHGATGVSFLAIPIALALGLIFLGAWMQMRFFRDQGRVLHGVRYQETELLKAATNPRTGHLADHLED